MKDKFLKDNPEVGFYHKAYLIVGTIRSMLFEMTDLNWDDLQGLASPRILYVHRNKNKILEALREPAAEETLNKLLKVPGIGIFIAYQLWLDWTYLGVYCNQFNQTENDTVISGPGCNRGIMCMIYGGKNFFTNRGDIYRDFNSKHSGRRFDNFMLWLKENLPQLMKENNLEWDEDKLFEGIDSPIKGFTLANIENSFCEFFKLNRVIYDLKIGGRYPDEFFESYYSDYDISLAK